MKPKVISHMISLIDGRNMTRRWTYPGEDKGQDAATEMRTE